MKTFILAAGDQTRWMHYSLNFPYKIKQLVPIHGIPLIHRTIGQVKGKKGFPYVVTNESKIADFINCSVINPAERLSIVQTLISTNQLWEGKTIILLGDVYYTADAINKIYACEDDYMFFGNKEEIFAIVINDPEEFSKAFIGLADIETNKMKLWHLYRFMHNIPLSKHDITEAFTYIRDRTTDFDCVLQYEKWRKKYDKR